MIIRSETPVKCSDCGDTYTPEQMRADSIRIHKMRDGQPLCELCHEDYMEKSCSCED